MVGVKHCEIYIYQVPHGDQLFVLYKVHAKHSLNLELNLKDSCIVDRLQNKI